MTTGSEYGLPSFFVEQAEPDLDFDGNRLDRWVPVATFYEIDDAKGFAKGASSGRRKLRVTIAHYEVYA